MISPAKRGRPAHDIARNACILHTHVPAETRAAVEAEAVRSGRSMSQVASEWLAKGQFWAAFERRIIEESAQ